MPATDTTTRHAALVRECNAALDRRPAFRDVMNYWPDVLVRLTCADLSTILAEALSEPVESMTAAEYAAELRRRDS